MIDTQPASDTSAEPRDDRKAVERMCAVTRAVRPVGELMRFVVAPDGTLTPDLRRRLPGRGVWVTARRATVTEAVKKKAFVRSLKTPVEVPPDLPDRIEALLERSALDMLSMANKAGLVAPGFSKAVERIESGAAAAVLQAGDGASDGARKVAAAVTRTYVDGTAPPLITFLTSAQISLALGRADVIHAALGRGPASAGFLERIAALEVWRGTAEPGHFGRRLEPAGGDGGPAGSFEPEGAPADSDEFEAGPGARDAGAEAGDRDANRGDPTAGGGRRGRPQIDTQDPGTE